MQNTLLAIALALIAAIVAALVGPWLIDWNAHKPRIEAEASRLFGTPVRIGGDLSIRLLPTIRIDARDVTVGTDRGGARIGRIRGDLRVAPLLRGEASLNTLHVRDADVSLSLSALPGRIVLVDDLTVENARLSVVDATGPAMLVLSGESRGDKGPVRLEGSAKVGESSLPLHLLMSLTESGELALRLRVAERADGPGIEAEGTIGASGRPRFDGDIVLTGRSGRLPWRVAGPVALTAQALVVQRVEAQAGAGDRLVRATGSFRYMFGPGGGLEAILNARQVDLDRLVDGPPRLPRDVLNVLLADVPQLADGSLPITLGFEIGGMVLGGAQLTDLRGDLQSGSGRWVVQRLSARLPGDSLIETAGDIALTGDQAFSGSLSVNAARPAVLMAWLDGLQAPAGTLDDPIQLSTRMTVDAGRLLLDDIRARTAAGQATGRLALDVPALGRHALQAQLDADALDLDLLMRIARGAGARLDPATDTRIQLRARQASLAGLLARDVDLAIATDGRTFDAERLRVGDLAGFGLDLTGRLDGLGGPLIGRLSGRLRAANVDGLVTLLSRSQGTRALADWLRDRSAALAGADLGVTFAASGRSALGLRIEGRVGEADLQIDAAGAGDPFDPSSLTGGTTVVVDAARADQIFALVAGTDAPAATPVARTRLTVLVERPDSTAWRLSGSAHSTVSTLSFEGQRRQDQTQLAASLRSTDIAALMPLIGVPAELAGALPATFDLRVSARGADWKTERADGRLGATTVSADLSGRGTAARGEVRLGALSGEAAMAFLSGPAWLVETGAGEFATAALGGTVFDRIDTEIGFTIARIGLGGYPALEGVTGRLVRQGQGVALSKVEGRIGAALLSAEARLDRSPLRSLLSTRLQLDKVPAGLAWPGATGELGLSAELAAEGASPAALVASLNGTGRLAWSAGAVTGAEPGALARVTRQAELAQDIGRPMTDMAFGAALAQALDREVSRSSAEASLTWSGLTLRSGIATFAVPGGRLTVSGTADLAEGTIGTAIRIAPEPIPDAETMPVIAMRFDGTIGAAKRTIDTDDVSGWLGLRLVDRATLRIRMTESDRLERVRQRAFSRYTMTPPPQVEIPLPPMPGPMSTDLFLRPDAPAAETPREATPVPAPRPVARPAAPPPGDLPSVVRRAL
ncbi:MAG: hypothetical protein FD152_3417, partial [Xanthobacteraceae bacterium]